LKIWGKYLPASIISKSLLWWLFSFINDCVFIFCYEYNLYFYY